MLENVRLEVHSAVRRRYQGFPNRSSPWCGIEDGACIKQRHQNCARTRYQCGYAGERRFLMTLEADLFSPVFVCRFSPAIIRLHPTEKPGMTNNRVVSAHHKGDESLDAAMTANALSKSPSAFTCLVHKKIKTVETLWTGVEKTTKTDYNRDAGRRGVNRRSLLRAAAAGRWDPTTRNLFFSCFPHFQPGSTSPFLRFSCVSRRKIFTPAAHYRQFSGFFSI